MKALLSCCYSGRLKHKPQLKHTWEPLNYVCRSSISLFLLVLRLLFCGSKECALNHIHALSTLKYVFVCTQVE